jgi:hypothetical protein
MDLVKRIYVPDLINNKEVKEPNEDNNKEVTTNNNNNEETKKIIFTGTTTKYQMKKVDSNKEKKEKKKKVETNTWGLNEQELSFDTQLEILKKLFYNTNNTNNINDKLTNFITSHIKTKISSYKHQDMLKNIFLETDFVTFHNIIELLNDCNMKCHYCACETYLLYEFVREMKQWSLDRINNDIGHNKGNLVIACLECNLKRRRTNKDAFFMTKNLTISREGI